LNKKVKFLHIPPTLGIVLGKIVGAFVGDVVLTKDELRGLVVNPVPRTYVRGFGALPFGEVRNIHPRTHVRSVLWFGVNKLCSSQKPNGQTLFSDWIRENKDTVSERYTSGLARHFFWRRVV